MWVLHWQRGIVGDEQSHLQGAMHMVVARLGCGRAMVGTEWGTSPPDLIDRLRNSSHPDLERKHYSDLVSFWERRL